MRTTIFAFVALISVVGFSGCGDSGNMVTPIKDMTMKGPPDLTQPLNGCNGYLNCIIDCNTNNPVQACYDDCDAGATQQAIDLLNTFATCIDTNCFMAVNADSGMPFCDTNSSDPTGDPVCNACYTRILGTGGACRADQTACTADKP